MSKKERQRRLLAFRKGIDERGTSCTIALTVDWLNEGIDVPEANVGVFLRTTESERIWKQQLAWMPTEGKPANNEAHLPGGRGEP
jgi:superfamily II DNA or RNA helicase